MEFLTVHERCQESLSVGQRDLIKQRIVNVLVFNHKSIQHANIYQKPSTEVELASFAAQKQFDDIFFA
jgi:hypothetical protein